MDFKELIQTRRSIRKFRAEEVEEEDLREILEAARLAPSASNLQPWKFIVIKSDKKKRLIAQAAGGQEFVGEAPVVIIACATGRGGFIGGYMESWPVDVAISVTHLLLAAWDRGLGTCWIGDFDEEKVKEICEIPPEVRVVAIVPMGYPVKIPQATSRRPWEKIVSMETFGE
ncbi:MAG TPA: nitroreductase family protein [Candidatus Atribacteria bacterium]|jgi:nitroreductase|uniref:nitroreductase family protein n=1 Tax=Candidatus Sordicultor fermentans TaxID=1953203 RepID=UPI00169D2F6A|nr:nitroreductase family protein [Atribacterota bacterium]NLY05081.1 nitroreductase [Candidatus Atribacteria bacterium]HOA98900.1 nitroreductase family protein [Candidatus Atribacteria bacterium]HOQ50761.1 nitroreductase family protein [Candidatus Atribacteria bacterium]HPT63479.1 nitroreductase family protein [Candidatus Atribacteria bacterium]